jgi:putative ABC transport system ATP-binding protein
MTMIAEFAPARPVSRAAEPLIRLTGLDKIYRTGKLSYQALRSVDLEIDRGEMVAVIGPSGSGKTTIMNMITGIDGPTAGEVVVGGQRISSMKQEQLAAWRGSNVGIVFQFFQLLPTLTAVENTMLPLDFNRTGSKVGRRERAAHCLERVGLGDKLDHLPSELSGGEQQRVAIARALVADPQLLIGDEPTGNLDTETARQMFELLSELNRAGTTIIYVTHDPELARRAPRRVEIRDGRVVGGGER